MKIAGICFTGNGMETAARIDAFLRREFSEKNFSEGAFQESALWQEKKKAENVEIFWYVKGSFLEEDDLFSFKSQNYAMNIRKLDKSLREWTGEKFGQVDALIFISSTGIAVRSIAPFVKDKFKDPAVIVVDEKGIFCISLLSGHVGGANALAETIAKGIDSIPVVTTATDLNGKFAVDLFARKNKLWISNRKYAKEISAAILAGHRVGLYMGRQICGTIPRELYLATEVTDNEPDHLPGICIGPSYANVPFEKTLYLVPPVLYVGIGCKKNTSRQAIEEAFQSCLRQHTLFEQAVVCLASIDLKKEEVGILDFCGAHGYPFITYSAEELNQVPGEFTGSDFVKKTTGVDNVCERSAMRAMLEFCGKATDHDAVESEDDGSASDESKKASETVSKTVNKPESKGVIADTEKWSGKEKGRIIVAKTACNGVTIAIAASEWSVQF